MLCYGAPMRSRLQDKPLMLGLMLLLAAAIGSVSVPSQVGMHPEHQELRGDNFIRGERGKSVWPSLIDFEFKWGLMLNGITGDV